MAFLPFTAPYFADVDGDGDPDGLIGSFYTTRFFRNDSVLPGPPAFVEETGYQHPLASSIVPFPGPVLADVDGDLDAFVGMGYYKSYDLGFIQYFENTGSPNDAGFLAPGTAWSWWTSTATATWTLWSRASARASRPSP